MLLPDSGRVLADRLPVRRAALSQIAELTERELEVLRLMALGDSNRAIAERLVVSLRTVEGHSRNILTKLLIPDTADDNRRVKAVLAYLRALGGGADADGVVLST